MIFKTWFSDINKVAIANDSLSGMRFDSKNASVVTAYTNAIKGLNEEQARYVLTKRYVSEADQADLLVKAQIISATEGVKASELSRQLVLQGLRKEQADALIEQISGNEAITSNTVLTKEQTTAILEQAEARKLLSAEQRQNIANDIEESASSAAEATAEMAQASSELAESTAKVGTTSSILARGVSQLGTGMKSLLSIFVSSPIAIIATLTSGIIALTYIIGKFQDSAKNAAKAASDFASSMSSINSTYNQETQTLNELTEKYQDLREQLIAAKGNEEETYSIKSQMLELQKQLNEIYGDEYDKVNLVTDAYRDQTGELKKNAKKKAENYLNENVDKIEEATKKMTSDYDYELGNFNYGLQDAPIGNELHDQIKKLAEKNGIEWDDNKGFVFKGTAEEASKAINQFMTDVRELRESEDGLSDGIIDNLKAFDSSMSEQLGYADEIIKGYQETYETAQMAQIASDTNLSNGYNQAIDAVEAYNDAVSKSDNPYDDENVKKAWDNLQTVKSGIQSNEDEWGQYSNIMDKVFSSASDDVYSFYQAIQNDDSIKSLTNDLQGLTDIDLQSMANDDTEDSFDKLCKAAKKYGLEVQDVIDLLIQLGIVQGKVQDSAPSNKTSVSSFSEAWSGAPDDLQTKLKELAEQGKLTKEEFENTDSENYFDGLGISADEAVNKINQLVSSSSQLESMSAQISKMSDMLADKKNGTTASASDLAGFNAEVRGLDSWEEFERVMGSSKSTMDECQKAANALATEWVNSNNFLSQLNDTNKDYYVTQLQNMGIENAEEVVTQELTRQKALLTAQAEYETLATEYNSDAKNENNQVTTDLTNATISEIAEIIAEGNATSDTQKAMAEFALSKFDVNNEKIDTSSDVKSIIAIANAAGASAEYVDALRIALENLVKAEKGKKQTSSLPTAGIGAAMANMAAEENVKYNKNAVAEALENAKKSIKGNKLKASDYIVKPTGSSNYKGGSSGGKSKSGSGKDKTNDTKQIVDWIERKISSLNDHIDLTQSKLDNLFNIKSPKNLSKKIDSVNDKLKTAQDNTTKWQNVLSKIKIPASAKKLIQSGKKVDLSKYSKSEQKNIKKYKSDWKKYSSWKKKASTLENKEWDLEAQKGKESYLKAQEKDYNTLAKVEDKAYKKYLSKAKSVKLSSSLKKKVQSGDYSISDYSSATQQKIQEYQQWWDKAQDAKKGKYEAKKNARDKKIERYQSYVDKYDAKREASQAEVDLNAGNYKKQNKELEKQKKYLKTSYDYQIKIAKAEGDTVKVQELKAKKQKENNDLTKQEFDNIVATYENKSKLNSDKKNAIQDALDLAQAKGEKIGSAYYTKQISLNNTELERQKKLRADLIKQLAKIPKGTQEWYDAQDTLFGVDSTIKQLEKDNVDLQKSITQLKFDRFDDLLDKLNDIVDETNFLKDMLSDNFFDDNGKITDDGVTAMGLTAQNYDTYLAEAEKYKEQIAELEQGYQNGEIDPEAYETKMREYRQGQREMIKSANDAKKAMIDYVKQGLDAQNDALEKAIEKQKELLEKEKEQKEFNEKIADQNKQIARLERQIAVTEGDTSDENKKNLRELRSKLADLKKEQSDTFYDKSISDQEEALDQMLKNSQDQEEQYLKDANKVFIDAINYVNDHTQQVSQNLEKISKDIGYDISENITNAWKDGGKAVGTYKDTLSTNVPNITSQIGLISAKWKEVAKAAEEAAQAMVKATTDNYSDFTGVGATGNGRGESSNSNKGDSNNKNAKLLSDVKKFINDHKDKPKREKSYYASLNQYLYDKVGGVLSKAEEIKLAKMLNVKLTTKDLTGDKGKKDIKNILKALKKIGFSNGGTIGKAIKQSGEDGFILARTGEEVLSLEKIKELGKSFQMMNPVLNNVKSMIPDSQIVQRQQPMAVNIDNRVTVEGVATDQIVKDFEKVAQKQAENTVAKINSLAYSKGVRRR